MFFLRMSAFFFLFAAASCSVFSPQNTKPAADSAATAPEDSERVSTNQQDLTFSELEALLEKYKFTRVSDLLRFLASPEGGSAEYLRHHTLGFRSRCTQQASPNRPRAIVYGKTAELVLAFNGDKSQTEFDRLHIMKFDSRSRSFEFREILFSGDTGQNRNQLNSAGSQKAGVPFVISPAGGFPLPGQNQGRCLECHRGGRPIWENYSQWPGFYGGDDDSLFFKKYKISLESSNNPATRQWLQFQSEKRGTRYVFLGTTAADPGLKGTSLEGSSRPNGRLNVLLNDLNQMRILGIIERAPKPILDHELCARMKGNFSSLAIQLELKALEHDLATLRQTSSENRTPFENSLHVKWMERQLAQKRADLRKGISHDPLFETFAKLERIFPKLQPQLLTLASSEGTYIFRDGSQTLGAGVNSLVQLVRATEVACKDL